MSKLQLPSGPHESASKIRSDSEFQSGKITLIGVSGEALNIINNSSLISNGSGEFTDMTITNQLSSNDIILTSDNNNIKIGNTTHLTDLDYPDLGTVNYTNNIGLSLTKDTVIPDAINQLEKWIDTYLVDTPPAPLFDDSGVFNNDYIYVSWTFPTVLDVGFSDINLPNHISVFVDYVQTSLNPLQDFSDASVVTVDTGSPNTTQINIYTETGISNLSGTTYEEYGDLLANTSYDVRVYLVNHNDVRNKKYLNVFGITTQGIGKPTQVLSPIITNTFELEIDLSWTKPIDHNDLELGNQTQPFIERYEINYTAINTTRFYGLIPDSGTESTAIAVAVNADTNLNITGLNPGTEYEFSITAYNSKNPNPSTASIINGTTNEPDSGTYIDNSLELSFPPALYAPFTQGAYTLDGSQFFNGIVNFNNIDGTLASLDLQTESTVDITLNQVGGASAPTPLSKITAYGGVQGSLESLSFDFDPFPDVSSLDTEVFTANIILGTEDNSDLYISDVLNKRGFWRSSKVYIRGNTLGTFKPTNDIYEFYLEQEFYNSGNINQSSSFIFAIDNLNIAPTLSGVGIRGILNDDSFYVSFISGVPTYNSVTEFLCNLNVINIGNNYLRDDKLHAELTLVDNDNGNTIISNIENITLDDIGIDHKYYDATVDDYVISSNLHNVTGLVLESVDDLNPRVTIQFNDFHFTVNTNIYTENLRLSAIAYSLYGSSSPVINNGFESNVSPTFQDLRIDIPSILNDRSSELPSTNYGQHVRSGGQYPLIADTDFGEPYDHTANILTDPDYNEELQLVNGLYRTPASSIGFLDYSDKYYPAAMVVTSPNYATVSPGVRYTTFKFTRSFSGLKNRATIELINQTGLTVDFSILDSANHELYIKVVDPRPLNPGDYTFETNWLDATNAIDILGVSNAPNGGGCLDTSLSDVDTRECILQPFTQDAIFYVKIGFNSTDDFSISNIELILS